MGSKGEKIANIDKIYIQTMFKYFARRHQNTNLILEYRQIIGNFSEMFSSKVSEFKPSSLSFYQESVDQYRKLRTAIFKKNFKDFEI